ncbi:hypothetical protein HOF92_16780, partial [bacterium]|nr:hypothetical protein [bacterium]
MRFFWLLIFPITLLLPHSHAGLKNYLESAKIKEEIKNEIAELDIGFKVDLFDLNLAEGVGISSRYRYEVEPSYIDDWYTRIDKWVLNTDLRPGDFIKDLDLPISVNVGNGMEVVFVRQFKTRKEAMKALPYTFARLPLKAKLARSKLQPGDFVSLPANLNVMVSAGTTATDGFLSAGAHTHYLLSGAFQIHLFRMKDDKVRVKLMALRKRGLGASASADIDFKIFGIGLVDRRIKRFIGVNIADLRYDKETGNLFLMDFIFDLKDSQSRKAYNQILGSTYKFKNLKILNPFQSHKEISQQLISDLTLTEDIFKEDREKPVERRRVDRIFKGSNEFERKSKNFKLGFKLIKYSKEQAYTENQISFVDREEKKHHYFFPTHTVVKKNSFLFGFAKSSTVMNYFALWPTDKDGRSLDESRHITVSKDPLDPDGDILISKLPPLEGASGDSPDYKDFGMSMDRKDKRMWGFE